MRVIICAAGDGTRWNNYLGHRKHYIKFDGETLLQRTVRMLAERGVTDVYVTHRPGESVPAGTPFERPAGLTNNAARLATCPLWSSEGRTLILWGDTYFTDAAMDLIVAPREGWTLYARLHASAVTEKPGPEIFAVGFDPTDQDRYAKVLAENTEARWSSWVAYAAMTGHPVTVEPKDIRNWGQCVEIPDDSTDDFDFPDDYERWMFHVLGRSSRRVIASDFREPWFADRMREMKLAHKLHRKAWEFSAITQAYSDRIGRGGRCLGFGVGREPVPAWLAAHGAQVVATDRPEAGVWLDRQHAKGKAELRWEGICTPEEYEGIEFAPCDMNAIDPAYHGQFDFTWSASCFEHLGGIEQGLRFFENQLACLKPGGIAVHTTEFNTASNGATINGGELCFFRQKDLLELTHRLHKKGDRLWPINLAPGRDPEDSIIDRPPFDGNVHLNLELGGHHFTSVLLIGMKG